LEDEEGKVILPLLFPLIPRKRLAPVPPWLSKVSILLSTSLGLGLRLTGLGRGIDDRLLGKLMYGTRSDGEEDVGARLPIR
jgi:hypothetical protein